MKIGGHFITKQTQVPISSISTFKNVGTIPYLFECDNINELQTLLSSLTTPFFILGNGSNLLINPNSTTKHFIKLAASFTQPTIDHTTLTIPTSLTTAKLLQLMQTHELSGLESCASVPASIGGMLYMNFGCWDSAISHFIERIHILDENNETKWLEKKELQFDYRKSPFQDKKIILLEVSLKLKKEKKENIKKNIEHFKNLRKEKHPMSDKTFGCIFKNPPNNFAAKLIESCGLKDYAIGHAQISKKHANFMINNGNATFDDALQLIHHVQKIVQEQHGLHLEPEVQIIH
jgi:UDP-N-acetylmuramate dehydrogenase